METTRKCLLGINSLFIGTNTLGTPNNKALRSILSEVTRNLVIASITAPLLKYPMDATCPLATKKV